MDYTEKLIALVQKHPCLYDMTNNSYRNTLKKEILWERIAKELNHNRDAVKGKWKNLKDGYLKYKKQKKGKPGQKKPYYNWVWGPHLKFLDITGAKPRGTSSDIEGQDTDILSMLSGPSSNPDVLDFSDLSDDPLSNLTTSQPASQSVINSTPVTSSTSLPRQPSSPSRKRDNDHDGVNTILEFLKSKKKSDAADHLFASYAETFKKLKPRTQTSVKLKLANIFAEAELQDLDSDNPSAASPGNSAISSPFDSDQGFILPPNVSEGFTIEIKHEN